jgi:DNA-binding response OmpR family regulator
MVVIDVVDDDFEVARQVINALDSKQFLVRHFERPSSFIHQALNAPPKCTIIDWKLPEISGIQLLVRIREILGRDVGVIMLTSMTEEPAIIEALNRGADDYICKPASSPVIRARLGSVLRRVNRNFDPTRESELGNFKLRYESQHVSVVGEPIELAPREFDLAWLLFNNPSRLFTKSELMSAIWGKDSSCTEHTLAQHIYSIRKKLQLTHNGVQLAAVYGCGYRLEINPLIEPLKQV